MDQSRSDRLDQEVEAVYQQYSSALLRYSRSLSNNEDGARDAVQEVFLRYLIERRYGRQIENPRAWLYLVMRNYHFERFRTEQKYQAIETPDNLPDSHDNPEGLLFRTALAQEIEQTLTLREGDCLRLRAEGFDYKEIGRHLRIRPGTVGALLSRVKMKLRRLAEDHEPGRCPSGAA